jgi:hypothetical protein
MPGLPDFENAELRPQRTCIGAHKKGSADLDRDFQLLIISSSAYASPGDYLIEPIRS